MKWSIKHFDQLSTQELYAIFQLRLAVFSVEQNCPYQDADGKDQASFHIMGFTDKEKLVAYARILSPGVSYAEVSIGRVVTATEARKNGIGKELMARTMDFARQQFGLVPVRISAQCYLIGFYESYGFTCVGEEYLEDHLPHIEMLLSGK